MAAHFLAWLPDKEELMQTKSIMLAIATILLASGALRADVFGTGANQFTIDFVTISGATNPSGSYGVVNRDYRMGTYEITNQQWDKFKAASGVVTGSPAAAYAQGSAFTGANLPANNVSWFEAAQFVNWLNTSTGHPAAYKFTGTPGTSSYSFATWSSDEAANNGTNLYRNKDAKYYLPTENEWVKAAYWNGTSFQTYATVAGETLTQGSGTSGKGWNYYTDTYAIDSVGPWAVGSGSRELSGTYDMMGNVWEWTEGPYNSSTYGVNSNRGLAGGSYLSGSGSLGFANIGGNAPSLESDSVGFRVAANHAPEPASLVLLAIGGAAMSTRRRRAGAAI